MFSDKIAHILNMFAYNCELVLHRREVIAKR